MSRKTLLFHSSLTSTVLIETLNRTIDRERWALFSLSGFKGDRLLLGDIGQDTFRLQKRRYYKNDFARQFYARFTPEPGRTRIEGYFDTPRFAKYFMRFWLVGVVLLGAPIFIMALLDLNRGSHYMSGDLRVGLIVPVGLILFGIFLPRVGRLLSRGEEDYILQFVQQVLVAQPDGQSLSISAR